MLSSLYWLKERALVLASEHLLVIGRLNYSWWHLSRAWALICDFKHGVMRLAIRLDKRVSTSGLWQHFDLPHSLRQGSGLFSFQRLALGFFIIKHNLGRLWDLNLETGWSFFALRMSCIGRRFYLFDIFGNCSIRFLCFLFAWPICITSNKLMKMSRVTSCHKAHWFLKELQSICRFSSWDTGCRCYASLLESLLTLNIL